MHNRFFDSSFGKALPYENTIQKNNRTGFANALSGQIGGSTPKLRVLEEPKGFRTPNKFYAVMHRPSKLILQQR